MNAQSPSAQSFRQGLRDGLPICMGYLSVSFAFGIAVVKHGFPPWVAILISVTNLTSAGQLAGLTVLAAGGGWIEMAMTQLIINLRYGLMSFSLTQKLSPRFRLPDRLAAGFMVTDEIFAMAASQPGEISRRYLFGLDLAPFWGWTLGTVCGAFAGNILPAGVLSALGIAIYGMFVAIVVPPAKKHKNVLGVVLLAVAFSCILYYVPGLNRMQPGFMIIISSVAAALIGARLWPMQIEETEAA